MAKKTAAKPAATKATTPEVLPAAITPDATEIATAGADATRWLAGMREFFAVAGQLEVAARERHERAMEIRAITSSEGQAVVQRLALETKAGKDQIEQHWSPIKRIFNRLHKTVTGAAGRAAKLEDDAFAHLNRLNNAYTEEQRRKAWEEQERIRREREAEERRRLQAQAAELERAAAEAEANAPDLSMREQAFVDHYVRLAPRELLQSDTLPLAERAAALAGFKEPAKYGGILLGRPKVQEAITAARHAAAMREQAEATKAAPVAVVVDDVAPDVVTVAKTATRWKARVTDEAAVIAAVVKGIIPADVLTVNQAQLNRYATMLQGQLNSWPGVEAWDDTRIRR